MFLLTVLPFNTLNVKINVQNLGGNKKLKGIKKIISLIICIAMVLSVVQIVAYADTLNLSGDYYYTVENGTATIMGYDNVIIEEVTLPSEIGGYPVTRIGDGAFANNNIITKITIPEGVLSIGASAFASCMNLRYIKLADSITSIGNGAFYGCGGIPSITLPKGLTVISNELFADCYDLKTVILPTGITTINSGAFTNCFNLTELNIPVTVTNIKAAAFSNNHLLSIYYCGSETEWNNIIIDEGNTSLADLKINFHKYSSIKVESTCSKVGHTIYTCSYCKHSYTVNDTASVLPPHDYNEEFTVDKVATDFEEGSKSRHCKNCDAVTDVTVIPITAIASGVYSDTVKWVIKKDGTLVISGSGVISDYKLPVFTPWYDYSECINSLEVSKDITKLGNNCFSSLENLKLAVINNPDCQFGYYVFALSENLIIKCYIDSTADFYAQKTGYISSYFEAPEAPVIESIVGNTATLKKISGYEYSVDRFNWQESNVFSINKNEIVTFYQRIAATNMAEASPSSDGKKGISVSAPDAILVGYDMISIRPMPDFEYGIEGVLWQKSNEFSKWIVPGYSYTVYQRYNGPEDVFAVYDTQGTSITVNGNNRTFEKNAEYLMWLKAHLLTTDNSKNLAADINDDYTIDIIDLIYLKNQLLEY